MFEQLVARELYMEARALLAENNTIVPAINRQLLVTIETTCEHQNSEALQALVNAYLFRDSARYILKHRCSKKIIDDICVDFAANKDQQSASYRAMLLVLRGCALLYEHDYHNSYESLRDALYVYPFEDCMDAVVLLLGAGHRESTIEHLLKFTSLENISPPPTDTHYAHMLKSHTTLRTLIKYERGIHSSKYSDDNMLVEKAMLYIDLCMAVASPILLANNMTMASNYLLQHMNTWLPDADQVDTYHARLYAYRNCICDLSGTALYFASRYLDPISVINYSAQIFSLMNSAHITLAKHIKLSKQSYNINGHNKRLLIDQDHQSLFNYTNSLLEKSIKVCPIVSMQLHSSSDILFVNMVNNEFLERYYTYYADNSKTLTHVYKYYLLEGSWKQWFPELMFVNRREHCMRALIRQKGLNINRIEAMMRWPTVRRDSSGWIDRRNLTLKLPGQTFTSVEEVSAHQPFPMRDGYSDAFLSVLSEELREDLRLDREGSTGISNYGQTHRFWIEAQELGYDETIDPDNGRRLNAVALLLRGVYDGLEASKREVRVDEQQLRDVLGRLRAQIQYPLNTEAKVREIYRETLRENGISSDQVRESDKGELKRKIRQSLDNQETKVLDQLAQALNEGLELDSPQWLRKEIDKWLRRGNADKMTELLRQHITNNRINKLDRFAQNCKKLGMPFDGEHGICDDFATNGVNDWIPAAYSRTSHCRTYGGVCLIPRLVNVNEPRSGGESSANGGDYGHGGSKSNSGQRSSSNSRRNGGSSGGGGGGNGKKRKGRFKSQKEGEELARSMSDKQANGKKIKVEFHSGVNKKKTEYYNPNRKGDKYAHFHPVDENGDKKEFDKDYYKFLGIDRTANSHDIHRAFRQKSRLYHPDKGSGNEELMKLLTQCKQTLLDPDMKARYDDKYDPGNNHENDNDQDDLTDKLRLNCGQKLSDNYLKKLDEWTEEFAGISLVDNREFVNQKWLELRDKLTSNSDTIEHSISERDIYTGFLIKNKKDTLLNELKKLIPDNIWSLNDIQSGKFLFAGYNLFKLDIFINNHKMGDRAYRFADSALYMLRHRCTKAINGVYLELSGGAGARGLSPDQPNDRPAPHRAMLLILRGCALLYEHDYHNSYESLRDALYVYPVADCMDAVVALLGAGHGLSAIEHLLSFIKLEDLRAPPSASQYAHMLKSNTTLRTLVKYERGIHSNKYRDNKTMVDKAMLYVDLCMAVGVPVLLVNNMTMASYYLLQHMLTWAPDDGQGGDTYLAHLYAYRNCICDLSGTVLYFASRYLDPISVVNYSALCFNMMNRAHVTLAKQIKLTKRTANTSNSNRREERLLIDEDHQSLFTMINHLLHKSTKVCPIVSMQLHSSSDIVFVNMVNTEFLERYYTYFVNNPSSATTNSLTHLYQYYLFEGSWKQWFPEHKFPVYREQCMRTLLRQKGLDVRRVEAMMRWPAVRRDSSGWIERHNLTLNLLGQTFTGVEGVVIDIEHGTFELLLANDPERPALINTTDIDEVLIRGITHGVFSLDPVSDTDHYDYHPFQRLRYSPGAIKDTHYLATLLHADYLLKMFTMGTEVSAHQPFPMRDGYSDAFLSVLPDELREDLRLDREGRTGASNYGQTHRFWIEAQELGYDETIDPDNGRRVIRFDQCKMVVKEHPMKRLSDGTLVDDTDTDGEHREATPEARFAKLFTECYDEIGEYFPLFPRLRELLKLQAVATIVRSVYESLEAGKRDVRVDPEKIRAILSRLRDQIQYPINTEQKVNELFTQTLRENGVHNEYEVSMSEVMRVKRDIGANLAGLEDQVLDQVARALDESLELERPQWLRPLTAHWIRYGEEQKLVHHLQRHMELRLVAKLARFGQGCRNMGMVFSDEQSDGDDFAKNGSNDWIPAAYSQSSQCRTYGGVCLVPRMKNVNAPASDQTRGATSAATGRGVQGMFNSAGGQSLSTGGGNGSDDAKRAMKTKQGVHVKIGPSGRPMIHTPRYSTCKAAREAAEKASKSQQHRVLNHNDPSKQKQLSGQKLHDHHNKNLKGDKNPYFHAVDSEGEKLNDGAHHLHPK
ncbi:unnamed protein product, partial [Medioppia subpectinata]